ncbi:MAG: PTS transporter subunit EIIC [Lachnospiraceae bacterium]|nr:PTS transporter subunit EIIC [Lachnospiraceae bacterium]
MRKIQKALMTGVSYMLPFIVIAGLTIALTGIATSYFKIDNAVITTLNGFGWTVMGFIPPILGAYVAFAIADKAGLAPGFVGGWIAQNPVLEGTSASGFLGAVLAGLIAGFLVQQLKKLPFPAVLDSLKSMLVIPLVSALALYFLMAYPVGYVVGALYDGIVNGLVGITEATLPYAFRDPVRVIGCNMAGAAVGGAMMMAFRISTPGVSGIIGIPPASNPLLFTLCIAAGVVVSVVLLVLVKKEVSEGMTKEEEVDFDIMF